MERYKNKKKLLTLILITSFVFLIISITQLNYYCMGFTTSLVLCTGTGLISFKIKEKNEAKFQEMINEIDDERLQFIDNKAKSVTLLTSIYIMCVICFIFAFLGRQELTMYFSLPLGIICVIYLITYYYFKKKY